MIVWDSQTTLSSLWKLCMLEKIYHHSNNPNLSTPIRKLGTVMPYWLMTKLIVKDAAMWNWWTFSTTLLDVNGVMAIVSTHHFIYMVYLYTGPSSVRTNTTRNASYSNEIVFLSTLKVTFSIYNLPKHFNYWSFYFTLYKLTAIILYIGHYVLFKTVAIRGNEKENRSFLPPFFTNKCLIPLTWAISNIINLLELWFNLISKVNLFLLFHIPMPHQSLIFNYIHVLQDLSIGDLKDKPPDLFYHNSPFKYSPTCHVITGD